MLIIKTISGKTVTLSIEGNMDTYHSVQLSDELEKIFVEGAFNIIIDLKELNYISSSGLRVLLAAQKKVTSLGAKMEIRGANDSVKEILKVTGFSNLLDIR
jgi:anti-sigma B factor antagonist